MEPSKPKRADPFRRVPTLTLSQRVFICNMLGPLVPTEMNGKLICFSQVCNEKNDKTTDYIVQIVGMLKYLKT